MDASQSLSANVPVSNVVESVLEAIRNSSSMALVSFNPSIPEGSPQMLRSTAAEVIGVDQQPMMMLRYFRKAETGESVFIGTEPS
jgi:hypothetical protein